MTNSKVEASIFMLQSSSFNLKYTFFILEFDVIEGIPTVVEINPPQLS
jgi:hypothetical protein